MHPLVQDIIKAYERAEERRQRSKQQSSSEKR